MPYYTCSKCNIRFHGMMKEEDFYKMPKEKQLCEDCFDESHGIIKGQF